MISDVALQITSVCEIKRCDYIYVTESHYSKVSSFSKRNCWLTENILTAIYEQLGQLVSKENVDNDTT